MNDLNNLGKGNILILIIFLVIFFIVYKKYFKIKLPLQTINFYSGGLGSGKTLQLTKTSRKLFLYSYRKNKITSFLHNNLKLSFIKIFPISYVYSNYPIRLKINLYSRILLKEHLLGQLRLPEHSIVVIDEASSIFPNQAKKSPYEISYNFRWFRHFVNSIILMADQSIGSVDIEIRRRVNIVYNFSNFKGYFGLAYSFNVSQIKYLEDLVINTNDINNFENHRYFNFFPLIKSYESRYFKYNYLVLNDNIEYSKWNDFFIKNEDIEDIKIYSDLIENNNDYCIENDKIEVRE